MGQWSHLGVLHELVLPPRHDGVVVREQHHRRRHARGHLRVVRGGEGRQGEQGRVEVGERESGRDGRRQRARRKAVGPPGRAWGGVGRLRLRGEWPSRQPAGSRARPPTDDAGGCTRLSIVGNGGNEALLPQCGMRAPPPPRLCCSPRSTRGGPLRPPPLYTASLHPPSLTGALYPPLLTSLSMWMTFSRVQPCARARVAAACDERGRGGGGGGRQRGRGMKIRSCDAGNVCNKQQNLHARGLQRGRIRAASATLRRTQSRRGIRM